MKNDIILSARGVVSRFGSQTVHDGVNLEVRRGEIVGLVGASGAGKSVLLKTLAGLRKPDDGDITIGGKAVGNLTPEETASLFAMLFQEGALFSSLTVEENVLLPLAEYTGLPEDARRRLAALKLAMVGLESAVALKYPAQLSGGMSTRAALARALALDPAILFLDEPTSGLDPLSAGQFDALIVKLNRTLGVTVVMATHDLDTLFSVCNRVAVLAGKKIVMDTLPNLLKRDDGWIGEFFHGPRAKGAAMAAKEVYGNA